MTSDISDNGQIETAMDTYHGFNKLMLRGAIGSFLIGAFVVYLISR